MIYFLTETEMEIDSKILIGPFHNLILIFDQITIYNSNMSRGIRSNYTRKYIITIKKKTKPIVTCINA